MCKLVAGKVLWIVGAGRGLGAAIAVSAASRGAKLVLTARTEAELDKVRADCLEAGRRCELRPEDVMVARLDLADTPGHAAAVARVLAAMGKVSGVVHCVGARHQARWHETCLDTDRQMFDTSVLGAVHLTR